jgi:hypothetical protein
VGGSIDEAGGAFAETGLQAVFPVEYPDAHAGAILSLPPKRMFMLNAADAPALFWQPIYDWLLAH